MVSLVQEAIGSFRASNPVLFYLSITGAAFAVFVAFLLEYLKPAGLRRLKNGKKPKLPPGPKGLPVLGHLLTLKNNRGDPDYKFVSLAPFRLRCSAARRKTDRRQKLRSLPKYGEMTTLHMGSKTWIVLNSKRVITEIINKRGSVTNTRSPMPISSGIVSHGHRRSLVMTQEKWAEPRRVMHHLLSGSALKQYGEWQELESTQMLAEYVLQPQLWYRHHLRYANSVVIRIALGERLRKTGKELAELQDVVTMFVGSVASSIVDWFPQLVKLPRFLQPWRAYWDALDEWNYGVYSSWWIPARDKVLNGTAPPSWVRDVVLNPETRFRGDDDDAMYLALQLIEAGSDTTREGLNIMVMAALEQPGCFKRLRADIDAVCGRDENARLPTLADAENLRYVWAFAKELLRWRPIFSLSPEHVSTQDIEFEGYSFPAGTGFVINMITAGDECENPDVFDPDRWMDGHEMDIAHGLWQFGGGRRICVGYRLAARSLFLTISRLVQCIDFAAVRFHLRVLVLCCFLFTYTGRP